MENEVEKIIKEAIKEMAVEGRYSQPTDSNLELLSLYYAKAVVQSLKDSGLKIVKDTSKDLVY